MYLRTSPQTLVHGERRLCKEGKEIPEMYYAFVLEKSYSPGPILSKLGQNFDWLIHAYIFVLHRQLKLCVILRFFCTFVFLNCRHRIKYSCYQGFFSFTARLFILCLFKKSVRDLSMAAFLRAHSAKRKRC